MANHSGLTAIIIVLVISLPITSCSMRGSLKVPTALRDLPIAPSVSNSVLFDCAQGFIDASSKTSSAWRKVTLSDPDRGILESGDFDDANAAGFRMRIERPTAQPLARMTLKGGGPYNVDMGVDSAADSVVSSIGECMTKQSAPR